RLRPPGRLCRPAAVPDVRRRPPRTGPVRGDLAQPPGAALGERLADRPSRPYNAPQTRGRRTCRPAPAHPGASHAVDSALGAVMGLAVLVVLKLLALLVLTRGNLGRIFPTTSVGLKLLADQTFLDKVQALLVAETKPPAPPRPSGEPLRLLTL